MKTVLTSSTVFFMACGPVLADGLSGIYRTERNRSGEYLHVALDMCESDPAKTCGTIVAAFDWENENLPEHSHLGKTIVWDMIETGNGKYSGGRVWAPEADKVYDSKIRAKGAKLNVSGCVGPICRTQIWIKQQETDA